MSYVKCPTCELDVHRQNICKTCELHWALFDTEAKIDKLETLLKSVNEHAETCSIFIYNEKGCTCYYEKIREYLND